MEEEEVTKEPQMSESEMIQTDFKSSPNIPFSDAGSTEVGTKDNSDGHLKFFVGGIHPNADSYELSTYFGRYGHVLAVNIMRNPMTGGHRGFGFVTIKIQENSQSVFADEHMILGQKVDVRPLQQDATSNLRRKIFVGGLAKTLTEDVLREYFERMGGIDQVIIMRQPDGTSRKFGFVIFSQEESAQKALMTPSHYIAGSKVDVRPAESRTKSARIPNGFMYMAPPQQQKQQQQVHMVPYSPYHTYPMYIYNHQAPGYNPVMYPAYPAYYTDPYQYGYVDYRVQAQQSQLRDRQDHY
ncbi:bifunctional RNA-binding domain superfamily/Nucleotide-binding alpha-beta plait domain superfamily/RNA recognition motif domain [Babesia duncani]|uniref:Bifunctional RNA-binding domain superfamily/Nucleotide-binding alpha-beta plait domain superfamily/RNA recognition motif domain n=1 Tax=Babesia duncani TaxID=323732 RepID=A0AAD9PKB5_9APIC|nr:bifunctional RNA-binding domain superfamily/Nucleotide-binding alpha-beta plait domain superfamily/RNA recognition motif domain [Babesia duncani]